MTTRTLLVTGGAGYIGSHMVRRLVRDGHRVVVLDNLARGNADAVDPGATLVRGALSDAVALARAFETGIDAVVHFAALAYVGESVRRPIEYYRNNVGGTLALLDAMRGHDVRRLVFSSTCATYGVPRTLPITEDTPQRPINPYGESKLVIERVLADLAVHGAFAPAADDGVVSDGRTDGGRTDGGRADGGRAGDARADAALDSVALRYFNAAGCTPDGALGERHDPETHLIPLVLLEALRVRAGGEPADTGLEVYGDDFDTRDGTCVRDYIHVEDLVCAHLRALELLFDAPGIGARRYNLGTNRGATVLEVIDACRRVTGVDVRCRMAPRRDGDPPELVADASLAMRELGWTPEWPNVESAIEHAWAWFERERGA